MRSLHGRIDGPLEVLSDTSVYGRVDGDVDVADHVTLLQHGVITGDLEIGDGAHVEVRGVVRGSVRNRGELVLHGHVRGRIETEAGGTLTGSGRRSRSGRSPSSRSR